MTLKIPLSMWIIKAMQLSYGTYNFPAGQVEVIPSFESIRDSAGRPMQYRWTIDARGMLLIDPTVSAALSPYSLSTNDNLMRTALSKVNQNLTLFDDFGRRTSIDFQTNNVIVPMQCISLNYPNGGSGEFVTKREFSARFQVTYENLNRVGSYISYNERVQIMGSGGRVLRWQNAINGPPVPVEVYPETTIRVIVSGSAVGYEKYPDVPNGPLHPIFLQNPDQVITEDEPKFMGGLIREYPVSWRYVYEGRADDLKPKNIRPRPWPLGK